MNDPILTAARLRSFRACYTDARLAELYDRPMNALEVLTRKDGAWADVPNKDRAWTVTRGGVLPDKVNRLAACAIATNHLDDAERRGVSIDPRSREAVEVARRYAVGKSTEAELKKAEAWLAWSAAAAEEAAARSWAWSFAVHAYIDIIHEHGMGDSR